MKTKAIFFVITIAVLFFASQNLKAQNDAVVGDYSVGKTSCTIEWDSYNKEYRVYWSGGTGYTVLMWIKDQPNGNIVYDEYERNWTDYTGEFIFKSDRFLSGTYVRSDGKEFSVRRQ
jgi:hypothetical protein